MSSLRKTILVVAGTAAVAVAAYWSLTATAKPEPAKPRALAQPVTIAVAESRSLPVTLTANGIVTPFNTVEVRPRVQNIVRSVHVKEGDDVKAGQLLFTLDDRSDRTEIDRARAQLARDRADLTEAQSSLDRNLELLAKGFVSKAVVDTAQSRVNALRGTVQAAQAAIESSAINAGYNRITASISGRIGTINVHPGSLAQPAGTPMLTIAQIDPVTVTFSLPERELAAIRASYPDSEAPVMASLGGTDQREGRLAFIDNTADPLSGTIRMKARFDNADRRLWPGTYTTVSIVSRTIKAVTVPAQAVVTGPTDKFVYIVQADDTVQRQKVDVLAIVDAQAALGSVAAGSRIVIEGMQNLKPGGKVREAKPQAGAQAGSDAAAADRSVR